MSSPDYARIRQVKTQLPGSESVRPYYVFNNGTDNGFVIISGDDRVKKVLGYSDCGSFDLNNIPPQLNAILQQYSEQIGLLQESGFTDPSWKKNRSSESNEIVLNTAEWGQDYPFNKYAPEIDGKKSLSGCVATAMAIVMKYNNWPEKGRGANKWQSNGITLDYNFENFEPDFSLMPDVYRDGEYDDKEADEVGKLMQAAGAAVNTRYFSEEAAGNAYVVGHYMHEYFRYSSSCQYISVENFDESVWLNMIYGQIDENHPVIMSGYNESSVGHAFVCDGYNSDHYLHINWGWNGVNNGFFLPFVLGGFDKELSMIINIFNDGNEKEYARCWNDYGYLWATKGVGAGFNVSVENIEKSVPFSANVGQLSFPNDFSGVVSLALVDEDENIIEVNDEVGFRVEPNSDWDHIGYSWAGHGAANFKNVVFESSVNEDMCVQVVAREDGDKWKLVLGTMEAPSSTKTAGNKPHFCELEWNLHDPYNIVDLVYQGDNKERVLLGEVSSVHMSVSGGVGYIIIDGILRANVSDFTPTPFGFEAVKDKYVIDVFANRYEDLLDRTILLEKSGSLSSMISPDERPLIYRLTIKGTMNADDYSFITSELCSLKHLDVSNTIIEGSDVNRPNYLPQTAGLRSTGDKVGATVWGLESIKLPEGLKGFEEFSMPHAGIEFLEIPESVETYGWNAVTGYGGMKLDYLKVNNPVPVDLIKDSGALDLVNDGLYRNNTVLYVPVGSKEAYAASPSWIGYKEIRESNEDFAGDFIDIDGVRYLVLSDFAVVSGIYSKEKKSFVVPEKIEYGGEYYPVTGMCRNFAVNNLYLPNTTKFDFNTINNNIGAVITPFVSADYTGIGNSDDCGLMLYVPGASADNYKQSGCNVCELWNYSIDRKSGKLSVIPDGVCSIDAVIINGEEAECIEDNTYALCGGKDLVVEVRFSAFNEDCQMLTRYSQEFNNKLPDSDLSYIDDVFADGDESVQIYNINGIVVDSETDALLPGIYIVRKGDSTSKIVVK
ncbi:MAG: thiol protease/hemagglutinin PrtT [Muribaculum sp.]|nr:thiol protease/hemagglutinin PrtT [Muribaculum sp.]